MTYKLSVAPPTAGTPCGSSSTAATASVRRPTPT